MGKLVLFLADATTLDIPLDRERIAIGRRADNDVCLPYPAVSAEHAAVVTILADSFLEDLGSTNGTLVNGKPIAKHFLRDRDQIDIGRQKLVYFQNDDAKIDPPRQSYARVASRTIGERVPPAAVPPVAVPAAGPAPAAVHALSGPPAAAAGMPWHGVERFVAAELAADARSDVGHAERDAALPPAPDAPAADPAPLPLIRVLTGPNAGRVVALSKPSTSIGRVGLQVAAVRRVGAECRLVPVEGTAPPRVNDAPIGAEGVLLRAGDVVEVAGVRLEFQTGERPILTPSSVPEAATGAK